MSKSKVIKYWLDNFQGLVKYKGTKLYTKVGPLICGLEIVNLPRVKEYRPHFVLYPLYRKNIKECLQYPELMFEIENISGPGKHCQYSLEFETESNSAKSVITDAKNQIGFTFTSSIKTNQINRLFDNQIDKGIRVPHLLKSKYLLNLVIEQNKGEEIISEIIERQKTWDINSFERYNGPFNEWLDNLKKINREELLKRIDRNSIHEDLNRLTNIELI